MATNTEHQPPDLVHRQDFRLIFRRVDLEKKHNSKDLLNRQNILL